MGVEGFAIAQATDFRIELRAVYRFIRECFPKSGETHNLDNSICKRRDF